MNIILSGGEVAVISDDDSDLAAFNWYLAGAGYAGRLKKKGVVLLMHRQILERKLNRPLKDTEVTDHINGDKLDNRRENLRSATKAQNMYNTKKRTYNTSGYRGVSYYKPSGKWKAQIKHDGVNEFLGYFNTPEEASKAYETAAKEIHGEFYREPV